MLWLHVTAFLCRGWECRYDPDVLLEQVVQSALVRHGSEKAAAKSLAATAALFNRSERTVADAVSKVRTSLLNAERSVDILHSTQTAYCSDSDQT